ncbi:MAG: hypothetical protein KJO67_05970 [Silicimonas sp.]|nr:hypothetical protein [Silicimonas sp.]
MSASIIAREKCRSENGSISTGADGDEAFEDPAGVASVSLAWYFRPNSIATKGDIRRLEKPSLCHSTCTQYVHIPRT